MQIIPASIEDAVEDLLAFYGQQLLEKAGQMSEGDFVAFAHPEAGRFVRDSWALWWRPGHNHPQWPEEVPPIVRFFQERGISSPDDMSTIILTSVYRTVRKVPVDLEGQILACLQYWKGKN
ncbi:DUF6794 domain-containing protein [Paraflavisolibacter sp. H34]|uniref:DUF6794 domain-containing protein n=1 Tax=Huijunlia imazamoxiresistens TaxID=3127457 RepID=UPI00301663AD